MRILVDMGHPTDVNLFRNVIKELERRGHEVKITAADKENTAMILEGYGFDYELRRHYKRLASKAVGVFINDIWLYKIARKFKPDIFISPGSPYAAQVSKLLGRAHIAFTNTERAKLAIRLMLPFTDVVCTPSCFRRDLGPKQVRFNSYYELAYLHPNYFKPDLAVLEKLNIDRNERYILLRFSALTSHHDIGVRGFGFKTRNEVQTFIKEIENYGQVFLTSEIKLGEEFERYKVRVPTTDFHSFVYFATMYIGEGAKTASEAAVLGVPSIYVSTTRRGYLDELEERYDLAYTFKNREDAFEKAIELLEDRNVKKEWQGKREKMLSEKIDTTKFMVEFIEDFVTDKMSS
ncbi:DUF354 domain-containing protein [Methanophagales archaeon]|nr:MAG: DUF354 domain-containing protein [Methanophagales archaeon]